MHTARAIGIPSTLMLVIGACNAGIKAGGGKGSDPAVHVSPAAVQDRVKAPPPPSTTVQTTLGKGKATVKTTNAVGDIDRFWVQELDIDGDGTVEQTELIWDDEDKTLFAYAETDVPCASTEGTAVVALIVCVSGEHNRRERPAGSGFYAVYFDAGECGAGAAGLYGCTFNNRGKPTECGAATIDEAVDLLRFAGAAESGKKKK